ncbi:MAG: glutaminyl-peptide cyclotransferase, partial [Prevotellaceae bacterium]|nr:glutaminyl-peptide cyclotransferase [Prevotellaceae bacterium]
MDFKARAVCRSRCGWGGVAAGLLALGCLLCLCCLGAQGTKAPKRYAYKVLKAYPHDAQAYTQGLCIHQGTLYEGLGLHGQSAIRTVDLKTGAVIKNRELPRRYFGEGICVLNGLLYQLTWREQTCFVYRCETLEQLAAMPYAGEGWGLTTNGAQLIMSNGSHVISYLSPRDMSVCKRLEVHTDKGNVDMLNELELVGGELW